jgi:ABC-type transport system involved in multi-copper enzyme maturation permease subunit
MYLIDNPVLQRELLVNLRMNRAFILLAVYLLLLGAVVWLAWPAERQIDMTSSAAAKSLVDLFFLGQYVLASLMAPSFAAGTITGEKERKTYESLLASPLRPSAIILGKLLAALCHLGILIVCSLPIVMLCVPLGGVSLYEVLAAYLALVVSVVCFGMISIACSSYFQRTVAALTVSYLIILPLALVGAFLWSALAPIGAVRLLLSITVLPAICGVIFCILFYSTARRLMHPPDVGSEGKEVVDLDQEMQQAVGMVIQSDQFPDKLFAPPKRDDLIPDGTNPVYDKEMRSELFSQGTLMLRVVIQVSMFLAIPLMAFFFYIWPHLAAWFISYELLFNMLVGPVFSADRVTSERERQTLELLLTTTVSPWDILWGKLLSGLRVSTVLTMFLVWPVALACLMVPYYWGNLLTMLGYVVIVTLACLTTGCVALFCSVVCRKTSTSMMCSYLIILGLYALPPAVMYFVDTFIVEPRVQAAEMAQRSTDEDTKSSDAAAEASEEDTAPSNAASALLQARALQAQAVQRMVHIGTLTSPFSAAHSLPLEMGRDYETEQENVRNRPGEWRLFFLHVAFTVLFNGLLLCAIFWLFNVRWRVTY